MPAQLLSKASGPCGQATLGGLYGYCCWFCLTRQAAPESVYGSPYVYRAPVDGLSQLLDRCRPLIGRDECLFAAIGATAAHHRCLIAITRVYCDERRRSRCTGKPQHRRGIRGKSVPHGSRVRFRRARALGIVFHQTATDLRRDDPRLPIADRIGGD
jgi:hypothetical protein